MKLQVANESAFSIGEETINLLISMKYNEMPYVLNRVKVLS